MKKPKHSLGRGLLLLVIPFVISFCQLQNVSAALTIHLNFLPGTPPTNTVGGGSMENIVRAAAKTWERAFADPSDPWDVYIDVEWAPLNTTLGQFTLCKEGGNPPREESGLIEFNNSGKTPFFLDPDPESNSAYKTYTEVTNDLGGGIVNMGRIYSDPVGDATNHFDLLQLAAHEIGHALGLLTDYSGYQRQVTGNTLTITGPLPHAGTTMFMFAGHIEIATTLMTNLGQQNERKLITALDVLVEAQLSSFRHPNLDPYLKPPPYITHINTLGTTLTLRATNGAPNGPYVLLNSTNLALPVAQWIPIATNIFDSQGNLNLTNIVAPTGSQQFFILSQ